jgi:DNA-binding NarL/FixJ family response regulator
MPGLEYAQNLYPINMKILIADPHPEVQSALLLTIRQIPGATEVLTADNQVQLLARCTQFCPDLVLFDLDLVYPTRTRYQGLADLIQVLRCLCPFSQVIVMSSRFEAEQESITAGANGFISKTAPPDEVFSDIVRFLDIHS